MTITSPTNMPLRKKLDEDTLTRVSRTELQKMAKVNGVKANVSTAELIRLLVKRSETHEIYASTTRVRVKMESVDEREVEPAVDGQQQQVPVAESSSLHRDNESPAVFGESASAALASLRSPPVSGPTGASKCFGVSDQPEEAKRDDRLAQDAEAVTLPDANGLSESFGIPYLLLPLSEDAQDQPRSASPSKQPILPNCARAADQESVVPEVGMSKDEEQGSLRSAGPPSADILVCMSSEDRLPLSDGYRASSPKARRKTSLFLPSSSSPPRHASPPAPLDDSLQANSLRRQVGSKNARRPTIDDEQTPNSPNGSLSDYVDSGPRERVAGYVRPKSSSPPNLPIPGPGNSAYSLSDCDSDHSGGYVPELADDGDLKRVASVMASLSAKYQGHLWNCKSITERMREVKMDAFMTRRAVVQEKAMSFRSALYMAFYNNTARAWARDAVWQYPIKLRVVNGEYEEVTTDDEGEPPHGLPEKKLCWEKYRIIPVEAAESSEEESQPAVHSRALGGTSRTHKSRNSRKRSRSDDDDDVGPVTSQQRNGSRKFARKSATPALPRGHNALLAAAREPYAHHREMSPVLEEAEGSDDSLVDEKSVESILEEALPSSPARPEMRANGSVFPRNRPRSPSAHVEVEDEAGEKHRRLSFEAKGKGRAAFNF